MNKNIIIKINGNGKIGTIGDGCDFKSIEEFFETITDAGCADYAGDEIADELYEINDLIDFYDLSFEVDYDNDKINEKVEEYLDGLVYDEIDDVIEQINNFIDEQEEDLIEALLNEGWDFGQVMDDINEVIYWQEENGANIAREEIDACYYELNNKKIILGYIVDYLDYDAIWEDMRMAGYWVETPCGYWVEIP